MTRRLLALVARPDVRFALLAFLVGRVAISLFAVVGWQLPHEQPEVATGWTAQPPDHAWEAAFTGLERYDAQYYLQIADHGYEAGDASSAFFPLYPLLIRVVGVALGGHWLLAATLVSNVSLVVALVLLQKLTARELGEVMSRPTVLLLLTFPVAFFLYAPYTESLFLALSLACMLMLRQGRWAPAALAGALATSTRITGVGLCAAMAVVAFGEAGWWPSGAARRRELARKLAWSVAASVGALSYFVWWGAHGSWREPMTAMSRDFGRSPSSPWQTLWEGAHQVASTGRNPVWFVFNVETVMAFGLLALGVVAIRRYPPAYGALVAVSLLMPLLTVVRGQPLTSVARYDMMAFPVFWVMAELCRRPLALVTAATLSSVFLGTLTLLFAAWHDVL